MNLGVEGFYSRTNYRHNLSESVFEDGAMKSAVLVLIPLVTSMARATGIRLPFYSRCDSNQVKPLSFRKTSFKRSHMKYSSLLTHFALTKC